MPFINLIVVLIIVGVLLWALSQIDQIDAGVKKLIRILVIVAATIYVCYALLGAFGHLGTLHFS